MFLKPHRTVIRTILARLIGKFSVALHTFITNAYREIYQSCDNAITTTSQYLLT